MKNIPNQQLISPGSGSANPSSQSAASLPPGSLSTYPWLTFLLPMAVFMVIGVLEPKPPADTADNGSWLGISIAYRHYPLIYTLKIALTALAILWVLPGYRTFRFHITPWALVIGSVGAVVWIGLCQLHLEARLLAPWGLDGLLDLGARSAYNPIVELSHAPLWAYGFLLVRLFGLVVVVSLMEEFFLRGFVMRFVVQPDWWKVPIGYVTPSALAIGTAVPVLLHLGEPLAALVWFSMVTWLMIKTKNIWDCVAAHALTNLLLGIYVLVTGHWWMM